MKSAVSISVLAIALITTAFSSAAAALEAYKTKSDQVVVTGLQPKKKYEIQSKNALGKNGKRRVETNACGEALIAKVGMFQSVIISGQNINPKTLIVKVHRRCAVRKKDTLIKTIYPKN